MEREADTGRPVAAATSEAAGQHAGVPVREAVRLDPVMRLTARNMLASHASSAPVTVFAEADATGLVNARQSFAASPDLPRVTYSHLLIKVLAEALVRHPRMNAAFFDDRIQVFDDINIGVAMAMPDGNLVVPVVHHADRLCVREVAARVADLQARGRIGRLGLADVRHGTFAVSNVGTVSCVRWTTPLLNLPQCAILAAGAIAERAVARSGAVVPQWVIDLSVTFDHRALNGFAVAEFTETLAGLIARPGKVLGLPDEASRGHGMVGDGGK